MKKKIFYWVILFCGFLLINLLACGGGGGGSSNVSTDQNTAVLAPNAKALDTATTSNLASVSTDGVKITFSSTTSQLNSLKVGDIIVSGATDAAPKGLLKKVVGTYTAADGSVQVTTSPAALTDAFEELHLKGTIASESSAVMAVKSAQQKLLLTSSIPKITFTIPKTPFSLSGQYDSSLSGNYTFNPVLDYVIDISNFTLKEFKLALKGPATFDLDETLTLWGALNVSPEKALTSVPIFIATITTGNPLINFTLEFIPSVGVALSAEGALNANFGFKSTCNLTTGIEYTNGDFLPVKSYDYSFDPYFSVDKTVAFSIKPYFRAKIGFYINDIAGPYFDLRPYGKFSYTVTPPPHAEQGIGITGNAGGEVKFLVWTMASINAQLFDDYYIWTSSNDVTPPSAPTGLTVTAASSSQVDLSWTASTENVTGYKVYKNGVYLKSVTATSASDTGLSPATNYCYYVTAYNSAGESVQTNEVCTKTIDILNVTGSWNGTYTFTSSTGGNGSYEIFLRLTQSGNAVTGSWTQTATASGPVLNSGTLSGTVNENIINITFSQTTACTGSFNVIGNVNGGIITITSGSGSDCSGTYTNIRGSVYKDTISINSITPTTATAGQSTSFTISVSYNLQSKDNGIVYVGFNTGSVGSFTLVDYRTVSKGSGTVLFNVAATPVNWGSSGDFAAYVNLSEYPHASSWMPLVTDKKLITVSSGTAKAMNSSNTALEDYGYPDQHQLYCNGDECNKP